MCQECGKGFCQDCSGLSCWSHHVALGGVPAAPARGTKKRKVQECVEVDNDWARWLDLWVSPQGESGLGWVSQESQTQVFKIHTTTK